MSAYSNKILLITQRYIGPSSERFLERQTTSHMNGLAFADVDKVHSKDLAHWVEVSAGLIIGKDKAAKLAEEILKA